MGDDYEMFKGRPDSPLRVGGYLEKDAAFAELDCSEHFAKVFDQIGFTAYDDHMLAQISELMQAAPSTVDFQFDVYPGGALGDMFSLEVKFGAARTELVHESFANGPGARIMHLLESWGIADERWKLGVEATLARTVPVELPNGTEERFAFIIMPQWVKVRWRGARLQPAKLYHVADAGPVPYGERAASAHR